MASTGLLALLDDLTTILDDVALLSKLALKKTAGVAGDDLAVGAQQVVGLEPSRELPIVWAVAKGSLRNKCWLVPGALLLSALAPGLILPIMMLGGAFLCYEGLEKFLHRLSGPEAESHKQVLSAAAGEGPESLLALEQQRIREAVKTDLILSAEIVVIALGSVAAAPLSVRVLTVSLVAVAITFVIYGLIALIVKLDDLGLYLSRGATRLQRAAGRQLLARMPFFMKALSLGGTLAMFLVGGGIIVHGVPGLEPALHGWAKGMTGLSALQTALEQVLVLAAGILTGLIASLLVALAVALRKRRPAQSKADRAEDRP